MNTVIRYSLLRILIFLGAMMLLWLCGVKNLLWLLLAAATLSMLISVFALNGMRDRMSAELAERVERRRREHTPSGDETAEDSESAAYSATPQSPIVENPDAFR